MNGLAQFKKGLKAERARFPNAVKSAQSGLAGRLYSGIILKTPVLTGHARHNWMPTVGEPLYQELEGVAGVDYTGEPFTETEIIKMRRVQRQLKATPLGEAIYICNNAPYIERLEHGYSQKAPTGMVEVTLLGVLEDVQSKRTLIDDSGV
jgi:hypothetical protein